MPDDHELPSAREILNTHQEIEEAYDMKYRGTRTVAPRLKFSRILEEVDEHSGLWMRAAALLRKVLTAHLFEDGNKRTAWVVTREFLERIDQKPAADRGEVERVLKRIRRYDVEEIATWLETGELDRSKLEP